jgi:predicted nucleotidyltransferase
MTKAEHRRETVSAELRRFALILSSLPDVLGAIVFGSVVSQEFHEYSDIDLVVIRNTQKPFMQRLREIRQLLMPKIATDFLVYTPEEIEQMRHERPFVREEILAQGKVLYERERGALALFCS